ncbi:hypothetical protein [Streptomyces sp. NPDC088736]|uniref:hypothetical protein n=1 Tax=Streptomyces sp. NPDC088736 TaxID=3365881 RepID=UPI00382A1B0E
MDIPDDLITLERDAETQRAQLAGLGDAEYEEQWRAWRAASEAVQAAITAHAEASGVNRYEVEAAVKAAVRHGDEDPAG